MKRDLPPPPPLQLLHCGENFGVFHKMIELKTQRGGVNEGGGDFAEGESSRG